VFITQAILSYQVASNNGDGDADGSVIDDPEEAPDFGLDQHELDERTQLIEVAGSVDLFAAPEFKQALMGAIDSGKRWIIVDLTAATLVDSTVLGTLLGARRRLSARRGGLAIVCPEPGIRKVFEVTGLERMFPVEAELEEALEALHASS
jgi:anti-sigma B factor antagonist